MLLLAAPPPVPLQLFVMLLLCLWLLLHDLCSLCAFVVIGDMAKFRNQNLCNLWTLVVVVIAGVVK